MNIFGKNVVDTCSILAEAASIEDAYVDSIYDQDVMDQFIDTFACLDELEEDCCAYLPQAVTVFKNDTDGYCIELEQLAKVADYNELDICEALEAVAEVNEISIDEMTVVIESDDFIGMIIAEAKCSKGTKAEKSKMDGLKKTTKAVKDMEEKGVKIKKKKSKSGKKLKKGKKDEEDI